MHTDAHAHKSCGVKRLHEAEPLATDTQSACEMGQSTQLVSVLVIPSHVFCTKGAIIRPTLRSMGRAPPSVADLMGPAAGGQKQNSHLKQVLI